LRGPLSKNEGHERNGDLCAVRAVDVWRAAAGYKIVSKDSSVEERRSGEMAACLGVSQLEH
jgi:hypothetical protein